MLLKRVQPWLLCLFSIAGGPRLAAQLQLGPYTLATPDAPTLKNPNHLDFGVNTQVYLAAIGGVAFDQTARWLGPLRPREITLEYRPGAPDGKRLLVAVDGQSASPGVYDWQLIPIARFADSPYYSAVTMFGALTDRALERQLRQRGADIINYHPALADTLLGLRLFQFDVLTLDPACTDLPKERGKYVLGAGETPPDPAAGAAGWNRYIAMLSGANFEGRGSFRSYVISDYGRTISFSLRPGAFDISGAPYIYYWHYKADESTYQAGAVRARIEREVENRLRLARSSRPQSFDERTWLIETLLQQAAAYEKWFDFYSAGTVVDLLSLAAGAERRAFLERFSTGALRELLGDISYGMESHQVVFLRQYSDYVSARGEVLRGINPQVWDAGVNLMRYAGFFRYVKQQHPGQWRRFLAGMAGVRPSPLVRTPTTWDREISGRRSRK
jgi:hypothetical protein